MEQISTCSLGGDRCVVDEAWRRHSPQRASAGAAPGSGCSLWRGACGGAGGLGELLPMGSHVGVPPKGCALWYGAVLERCLRICSLWKAWRGSVWEGQHSMRRTPQRGRGRKRPWRSSRLSTAPIPCTAQERETEEGEWGEGAFSSLLVHCCQLLAIENKLHYSPYAASILPVTIIVEQSPCPYLSPSALFLHIFSYSFEERQREFSCPSDEPTTAVCSWRLAGLRSLESP